MYILVGQLYILVKIVHFIRKLVQFWTNVKFVVIFALFVWRKVQLKICLVEKTEKYQVCPAALNGRISGGPEGEWLHHHSFPF